MATSRSTAAAHVRRIVSGSPAWNPHATFALVTTSSRARSSPSRHTPNPSPRSALRSIRSRLAPHERLLAGGFDGREPVLEHLVLVVGLVAAGDECVAQLAGVAQGHVGALAPAGGHGVD